MKKSAAKEIYVQGSWFVYILDCFGGRLYTGMTNNVARRFQQHCNGKGGHFTRAFKPVRLLYTERCASRSDALKREARIKKLTRKEKLLLIRTNASNFTRRLKKNIIK
ncbi:MAG: GIY-YIG nuclease family protein [Endomicrobiales bacterium]|jgi:putative endonuclease